MIMSKLISESSSSCILGIDPSFSNTGLVLAMWDNSSENTHIVSSELIQTSPDKAYIKAHGVIQDDLRRVGLLIDGLNAYLDTLPPYQLVGELPSGSQNHSGTKSVYVSMCLLNLASRHPNCIESRYYKPREIKLALTGDSKASKQDMIKGALAYCSGLDRSETIIGKNGKVLLTKAEHVADAYASIHKYVQDNL